MFLSLMQMENNGGFNVLVYPNVDYAFIVALLMIVNDIDCSDGAQDNTDNIINGMQIIAASIGLSE